jgi:hypothetical protein
MFGASWEVLRWVHKRFEEIIKVMYLCRYYALFVIQIAASLDRHSSIQLILPTQNNMESCPNVRLFLDAGDSAA